MSGRRGGGAEREARVDAQGAAGADGDVSATADRPWSRYWVLAVALVAGALAASGVVDDGARTSTDRIFRQALLTYAAARTLDGAVSLAEGTEIALEPGGVGVTISAGEVLEPLDDLVEQFSSVMLVSATSLGIQSLAVRASAWWVLTGLLFVFLAARVLTAFFPHRVGPGLRRFVGATVVILLVCRFAVPLYALGTAALFDRFLHPSQVEALQAIEEASGDVREIEGLGEDEPEPGWMGRVSAWFSGTVERLDVPERVEAFRERVSRTTEHVMHLVVVFVLQTIVLPLAFLWLLPKTVRGMTHWSARAG